MSMQEHHEECKGCRKYSKLCPFSLALAAGIVCGLGTMLLGWIAHAEWGMGAVQMMASVYKGFGPGLTGGLWGALWGFLDGFVTGLVFTLIYNACLCCAKARCRCCKGKCETPKKL